MTCIRCPVGCKLLIRIDGDEIVVEKNLCPKGEEFGKEEFKNPKRILPTSMKVVGGEMPLVSVKTSAPIPRERIMDVMEEIKRISVRAPVRLGQVIIENVLNLGVDIVATREVRSSGSTSPRAHGRNLSLSGRSTLP